MRACSGVSAELLAGCWRQVAAYLEAHGRGGEAGVEQVAGERMLGDGDAVDRGDEQAGTLAVVASAGGALDAFDEELGEAAGHVAAGRFVVGIGKEDLQVGIAAAKVGDEHAVAEDDV